MFEKNSRSLNDPVVKDRNKEIRNLFAKRIALQLGVTTAVVVALHVAAKALENHNEPNED